MRARGGSRILHRERFDFEIASCGHLQGVGKVEKAGKWRAGGVRGSWILPILRELY